MILEYPTSNDVLPYTPTYELVETDSRTKEIAEILAKHTILAVDTETTGLNPLDNRVLLLQIATPDIGYVFDCNKVDVLLLKPLLEDTSILKLVQNVKFDYKMLKANYGIELSNVFCTLIAEQVLTAGLNVRRSLKVLAEKYLGFTMDKSIGKSFIGRSPYAPYTEEELLYAVNDVLVLHPIYEQQTQELIDTNLVKVALLEFNCVTIVGDMELSGCLLDTQRWESIIDRIKSDRDVVSKVILKQLSPVVAQNTLFGLPAINLGSPIQLLGCLVKLGIKERRGKPIADTGEDTLKEVRNQHPVVKDILLYRELDKLFTSYGASFLEKIHKKSGRLHSSFNQLRAATGRMSSSKPNLQQVPGSYKPEGFDEKFIIRPGGFQAVYDTVGKPGEHLVLAELRTCFVSSPGKKLVVADYSQQELRVLADASGDPTFGEAYMNNEDIHKKTAADVFKVPLERVAKEQRRVAKTLNFALIYGARAWKISHELDISEEKAQKIIDAYFKVYNGIGGFLQECSNAAIRNGYSETVIGRRRYYKIPQPTDLDFKKILSKIRRQAPNHYVQGSSADVTKQALVYINESIRSQRLDARVLMVIHDEFVLEVAENQADVAASLLEGAMIRGFSTFFKKIPMKVDAAVVDYWSKD